jgi:predicted CXXCH cytochrome family protein
MNALYCLFSDARPGYCSALAPLVALLFLFANGAQGENENRFVGTASCAGCHQAAHARWQGSHHDLAMQKPSQESVLGDFDNATFDYFGRKTQFFTRNGDYIVRTDGPDGELREYKVAWVFGVDPLQQYLLPMEDGRLQTLSIAWDSRPAAEGGQRWYHLYPDEEILSDDPLHWTGPYQNWNTRCAECHSTDVQKNYDVTSGTFATQFAEEDVGCEACHGPGSRHIELAMAGRLASGSQSGLETQLTARGDWYFPEGEAIARRRSPLADQQQIDSCGRCHARRGTLGDYRYGKPLTDTHRLSLLGEPLYHHDGQILDEVYVYGSFIQSKMHRAGVVCSNCHEPHSNKLRAEGNGVCAQCHKASVFDNPAHHHHAQASAGSQCVNCHMPAQVYMGVDSRRDHSMRIPRPDLSVMIGTPNACTQCHGDQSAQWALDKVRSWGIEFGDSAAHPAVAMAAIQGGDSRGLPTLLALANDPAAASIWRATALERSASGGSPEALELAQKMLLSRDPLLRVSAVRVLQQLPLPQRYASLKPLISDPISSVRLEVAMALAPVPLAQLNAEGQRELLGLFEEYQRIQRQNADMPSINMQRGLFYLARGDFPAAESAYREAIRQNPQLIAAHLNLADLLRSQGRESEARSELESSLTISPGNGDAMHALGLLEARAGQREAALDWLGQAAAIESQGSRHRFVYAVAQHDFGDVTGAITTLRQVHAALPADEQVLLALINYNSELGERDSAKRYAEKLLLIAPNNQDYRRLAASLGAGPGR